MLKYKIPQIVTLTPEISAEPIFSIAPLIDKSFLNISIKKAVPSEDTAFFM